MQQALCLWLLRIWVLRGIGCFVAFCPGVQLLRGIGCQQVHAGGVTPQNAQTIVEGQDLVTPGSYCVVFDTVIEDLAATGDRPWGPGNSPKTAVWEFLKSNPNFEIDRQIDNKLQISVAPDGYLHRVR